MDASCRPVACGLRPFDGAVPALEGFDDGEWWVQDAAAALPAQLFGELAGKRVADLCAAPGGKTAQLVLAGGERDGPRSIRKPLEASAAAISPGSASKRDRRRKSIWRISAQTSCSMRSCSTRPAPRPARSAAIRMFCGRRDRRTSRSWPVLQERLLRHALTLVKPGGLVVFSNCSLDPREGEEVAEPDLAEGDCERVAIDPADWPGLEDAITPLGEFRTTPAMIPPQDGFSGGLDGFYAVILRRKT